MTDFQKIEALMFLTESISDAFELSELFDIDVAQSQHILYVSDYYTAFSSEDISSALAKLLLTSNYNPESLSERSHQPVEDCNRIILNFKTA